ncbi:MAG TPA: hypothetical protein VNK95_01735 [Caldilineaceae bacterium]|nr:hypothetical protein [Caldilineaceae bacterium]
MSALQDIATLLKYFARVIESGDAVNKWLDLLPVHIQPATQVLGEWLAGLWW